MTFAGLIRISLYLLFNLFSLKGLAYLCGISVIAYILFMLILGRYLLKRTELTEEHLIIGKDVIPWSDIEHVRLKKSEYGNPYLVFHFTDERPPKSYDADYFITVEEFVNELVEKAGEKGITFSVDRHVELKGEILDWFEAARGLEKWYPRIKEEAKRNWEKEREKRKKAMKQREETQKSGKKREIKISPRQETILMIFLAVFFFLGLYFVLGMQWAVSLSLAVLVHECGHLLASKFFHLKVRGLFFIPFFGAGVVLKDKLPSPQVEAAVALAEPVAGLSWNTIAHCDILYFNPPHFDLFLHIVFVNLLLNMLNLAPILPLDGGRIFRAALLRGRRSLIPVAVVAVGSGVVAGIYLKSIFFLVIAAVGLGSLVYSYRRMEKKEVEPPSRWKSASILGAWIAVICLYWYTIPHSYKVFWGLFPEMLLPD